MVERIYLTRGDNGYSWCSYARRQLKCDKNIGLKIDGKLYWLETSTCCLRHASHDLRAFNILVSPSGKTYRITTTDGDIERLPLTRVQGHPDDLFSDSSKWVNQAERTTEGRFWHEVAALAGATV